MNWWASSDMGLGVGQTAIVVVVATIAILLGTYRGSRHE